MKALIAMSGGVDSSVAAFLMQQAGYDCTGCTMKLFDNDDAGLPWDSGCCSEADLLDAADVAKRLGISYHVFHYEEEFRRCVIVPFAEDYRDGLTPNPCIRCNRYLKWGALGQLAEALDFDKLVTGHYARILEQDGRYRLLRARDETKDQSYVLFHMTQEQLSRTLFPLVDLTKAQVRKLAEENGFVNARKRDSQDICFAPDGDYARVIREFGFDTSPGDFIDRDGKILGRHKGIVHYTVGQRRGLGVSAPEPLYVLGIDPVGNTVTLGPNEALFRTELLAGDFNWISGSAPERPVRCQASIRYSHRAQPALCEAEGDLVRVTFDEAQRAITPGQAVVLYQGDEVLGGGTILPAEKA